jgi:hypothetical protein
MLQEELCLAIQTRRVVQFYYSGEYASGNRVVEPHMVAYNLANHFALSAWFLSGVSASQSGPGWREYLLAYISNVIVLPTTFPGPRPGYRPDGGKTFHNVQCAL